MDHLRDLNSFRSRLDHRASLDTFVSVDEAQGGIPDKKRVSGIPDRKEPRPNKRTDTTAQKKVRKRAQSKSRRPMSKSAMYKHMVVAIYKRIKDTGYDVQGTPEKAAQAIARGRMIQWKYARRGQRSGGVPDRHGISLTAKGKNRSKQHAREPKRVNKRKDRMFARIFGRED